MTDNKVAEDKRREISPGEAAKKRAEILDKLQRPPRAGDEQDDPENEPTVSTMILPGD
ncbi:MAG: hypothetical protein HKN19_02065 [Halioglobus sp.]|nr:hypothetical protein [Halioglobus sp.]